jgi:hypothetical protein
MAWVPPVRLSGLPKRDTSRLGLEDPPLNSNSTELGTTSPEGFEDLLLYGPTNDGFVEPASVTAHLMQLMTLSLVMCREITADRLWAVVAAGKLTEAMGEALYVSATELDGRIKHFPLRPTKARVSGRISRKGRRPDPWP